MCNNLILFFLLLNSYLLPIIFLLRKILDDLYVFLMLLGN